MRGAPTRDLRCRSRLGIPGAIPVTTVAGIPVAMRAHRATRDRPYGVGLEGEAVRGIPSGRAPVDRGPRETEGPRQAGSSGFQRDAPGSCTFSKARGRSAERDR
jgi:hypothetical protein